MKNKSIHQLLFGLILILTQTVAWSFNIYSPTGEPIPEKMNQEESRLNLLNSRTNEVVASHGRYAMVRDTLFLGTTGTNERSKQWFADATIWLSTLDYVVSAFQTSSIDTLATASVRNQIRTQINKAYVDFQKLAKEAMVIRLISKQSLTELGKIRRIEAPFVTDFDFPILFFIEKVTTLEDGVITVNNTLNNTFIKSTNLAITKTREASELLLKNAVLNTQYSAIVAQLEMMQSALLAESIFAPYYADLLDLKLSINTLVNDSMVYKAKARLTEMEALALMATTALNNAGIPATEVQNSIVQINDLLGKAQNSVALIMTTPAAAVLRLYRTTTKTPALLCKYPYGQKKYNCQLLKSLGGLLDQDIMTMPEVDLRVLENAMKDVLDGPLGSATGGI